MVIKEVWYTAVGEELSCMREVENYRDPFAVAAVRSGVIVGQVPSLAVSRLDALKLRIKDIMNWCEVDQL